MISMYIHKNLLYIIIYSEIYSGFEGRHMLQANKMCDRNKNENSDSSREKDIIARCFHTTKRDVLFFD